MSFQDEKDIWQVNLPVIARLRASNCDITYRVKASGGKDVAFVEVKYYEDHFGNAKFLAQIRSKDNTFKADLAYNETFTSYGTIGGHGHLTRDGPYSFRTENWSEVVAQVISPESENWASQPVVSIGSTEPDGVLDGITHSDEGIEVQGIDCECEVDYPITYKKFCIFCFRDLCQSACSSTHKETVVTRSEELGDVSVYEQCGILCHPHEAIIASLKGEAVYIKMRSEGGTKAHFCDSCLCDTNCFKKAQLGYLDPDDLYPLYESPVTKQVNTYDYALKQVSKRAPKRRKQLRQTKLRMDIEPQMFETIGEALSSVKGVATGINALAKAIDATATTGVKVDGEVLSKLDELLACGNKFADKGLEHRLSVDMPQLSVESFFSWIYERRHKIGVFVLIVLVLVLLLRKTDNAIIMAILGLGGVLIEHYHGEYIRDIWNGIECAVVMYFNTIEPQSFDFPWLESILKGAYLFIFKDFSRDIMEGHFTTFFRKIVTAPSTMKGMSENIEYWVKVLQDIVNATFEFFGSSRRLNVASERYPQVREIADRVATFMESYSDKGTIVLTLSQTSKRLQGQIQDLLLKYKHDRDFTGSRTLLNGLRSKLEMVDRELELRGAGKDVTRVAPAAYLFMGKPGIGKSYLLRNLCTMSLYHLYKEDKTALEQIRAKQIRDFLYTRNSDDKYWEGYYNQPIVYLDEVAMQKDASATNTETNEYSSFIKMVNDVTYPLIMANVEKKGLVEFDSEIILGTTNMSHFDIQSINNVDAYDRRWNAWEVEVDPRYGYLCKLSGTDVEYYRPDWQKIDVMGVEFKALSKFLRFRRRATLFRQGYLGDWVSMDTMIANIRKSLDDRNRHKEERQSHEDFIHNYFFADENKPESPGYYPEIVPQGYGSKDDELLMCKCLHCKEHYQCYGPYQQGSNLSDFTDEQKDVYASSLKAPWHVLEDSFYKGFSSVKTFDSPGYRRRKERVCAALIKQIYGVTHGPGIMYIHGQMIKSAYLDLMAPPLSRRIKDSCDEMITWAKYKAKQMWVDILSEEMQETWEYCKVFLKSFAVAFTFFKLFSWISGFGSEPKRKSKRVKNEAIEVQSSDLNADEVVQKVTNRNVYSVGDDYEPLIGHCMFMTDNIILLPNHYLKRWRKKFDESGPFNVHFKRVGDNVRHQVIKFDVEPLISEDEIFYPYGPDSDIAAVYLTNRVMQRHASIRRYLIPDNDFNKHGTCVMPHVENGSLLGLFDGEYVVEKTKLTYPVKGGVLTVTNPVSYRITTEVGDCGLPVAIQNPGYRCEKIFGLHIAAYKGKDIGISHPLTVKAYDAIVDHFCAKHSLIEAQYRTEADVLHEFNRSDRGWDDLISPPEGKRVPGKVNLGYVEPANLPSSTVIRRSPLYGQLDFDPKTVPALLRPFRRDGVIIDPAELATAKYHHSIESLDLDVVDSCVAQYTDLVVNHPLSAIDERVGRQVLSFDEAVSGIPGVDGLDGLPRKTSAGYPWCKLVKGKGKTDFFGKDGDYILDSPECDKLRDYVDDIISSAKTGKRKLHVFMDFHKDERRPKEKALAGKTRKISACGVDLSIAIRMYFGAFVCYYMQNRIYNQSAVGVNVYSSEWDQIAHYLGPESRYIAGDFSNYDGKLPYCIMIRFLDTVTSFYRDKGSVNERVRDVLFQELCNSRHVLDGVIYEWVGSNASGNPLTTVLNSWCNNIILRYATLRILGCDNMNKAPATLRKLDENLRFMVYGDDNIIATDRASPWIELLTQDNYTKALADMGFEYTDELKTGDAVSQDRSLEEVSFLKRKWARTSIHPKRKWLSPLDINTIMESIQWTKKKDYNYDYVKDNCLNMILELSQHDKDTFNRWCPKIVKGCEEHLKYTPIPNDYRICQLTVINREMLF